MHTAQKRQRVCDEGVYLHSCLAGWLCNTNSELILIALSRPLLDDENEPRWIASYYGNAITKSLILARTLLNNENEFRLQAHICAHITNVTFLSCSVLGKFGTLLCVESDNERRVSFLPGMVCSLMLLFEVRQVWMCEKMSRANILRTEFTAEWDNSVIEDTKKDH